jgi:folate-dependent phosphoribosylglycinamide formyltransferase PurN
LPFGQILNIVQEEVDTGGIVLQHPVAVFPDDSHDSLHQRIKAVEHKLFPKAMEAVCRGDAERADNGQVQWTNYQVYMDDSV